MIGHHGTHREFARSILASGFNRSHGEQWFGDGVYFFEDDPVEAKNWAIKIKGFGEAYTSVLRSTINSVNGNIIDLTKGKHWEAFLKIRKEIDENIDKSTFRNKIYGDGIALNFMCRQFFKRVGEPIDLIKAGLKHPGYDWADPITNIPRMQYQICVRNLTCIADIKVEEGF